MLATPTPAVTAVPVEIGFVAKGFALAIAAGFDPSGGGFTGAPVVLPCNKEDAVTISCNDCTGLFMKLQCEILEASEQATATRGNKQQRHKMLLLTLIYDMAPQHTTQ